MPERALYQPRRLSVKLHQDHEAGPKGELLDSFIELHSYPSMCGTHFALREYIDMG